MKLPSPLFLHKFFCVTSYNISQNIWNAIDLASLILMIMNLVVIDG